MTWKVPNFRVITINQGKFKIGLSEFLQLANMHLPLRNPHIYKFRLTNLAKNVININFQPFSTTFNLIVISLEGRIKKLKAPKHVTLQNDHSVDLP